MINKEDAEYIFDCLAHKIKTYDSLGLEFHLHKTTLCKQMSKFKAEFGLKPEEKYCAKTFLRYKYSKEIVQAYEEGESTKAIAQKYGFSDDHMIAELLRELNAEVRGVGYTSKTDQSLFQTIDSEISAYTLGLITADGSVNDQYMVSIELQADDKDLLNEINSRMFKHTGTIIPTRNQFRLSVCGKQVCQNLKQYNVIPNKTYSLTRLQHFEEPFMQHYLRGLYDGDGVCAENKPYLRVGYCGYNQSFVEDFQNYLVDKLGLRKNKLFNTSNSWNCSWGSKEDLNKLYNYLYQDATIFLSRKQQKLYTYLYDNTEVNDSITQGESSPQSVAGE